MLTMNFVTSLMMSLNTVNDVTPLKASTVFSGAGAKSVGKPVRYYG
jgi:hypothetical protein